jgi:hypothetical protein
MSLKIGITTDASWHSLLCAVEHLANKIIDDCPGEFALWDAERLEAVARAIRKTCPQESY